jgi:rhodanese-related sulfurtransferase
VTSPADQLVARARRVINRIGPAEFAEVQEAGGLIVDIRPASQRADEGALPGALVVERNVLEWRLDPSGSHRLPDVTSFDQPVVVFCSEGYASSLAAESLHYLGYRRVSDLAGGYQAWRAWVNAGRPAVSEDSPDAAAVEHDPASA